MSKSLKKLVRVVGWAVGAFLGVCAVGVLALYVYFAEPYIAHREWRVSTEPETIKVVYVLYACGDHSPRLYEAVSTDDGSLKWRDRPTILSLPAGVPSPEDTEAAVSGNVFHLTGYRHQAEERNILTGAVRTFLSTRFDLVSWQVETPYDVWVTSGTDDPAERRERNDPMGFKMKGSHGDLAGFEPRHYVAC